MNPINLRNSLLLSLLVCTGTALAAENAINPGTPWPAMDALGRSVPPGSAVANPRADRFVGIFYFLWNNRDSDRLPNDLANIRRYKGAPPLPVASAAKTRQPLTPRTDPNWMWLLIDADLNPKTGWEGYDFILNRTMDGQTTWLDKNTGGWNWEKLAKVEVVTIGNELMLAVPRQTLGLPPGDAMQLDFKWWDNAQKPGDIMDTYLSGDCAPDARFNYRFTTAPISAHPRWRK